MACNRVPMAYQNRVKIGCNNSRCGTFQFQETCCDTVPTAMGGSYVAPLTCPVLQGSLLIPFTNDPLTSTNLVRSRFDEGRIIKTTLVEGTDFDGTVYPDLPAQVNFNVIDFTALQKFPAIIFTAGSIRVHVLARQFMGKYILETANDSPNQASDLPIGTVTGQIFTDAYGGCGQFSIDFVA